MVRYLLAAAAALCLAAPAEATVLWTGTTPASEPYPFGLVPLTSGNWTMSFNGWSPSDGAIGLAVIFREYFHYCVNSVCTDGGDGNYDTAVEYNGTPIAITWGPNEAPVANGTYVERYLAIGSIYGGDSSKTYSLVGNLSVPEPATWAMMLVGFGALGFTLRRKRSQDHHTATA